MLKRIILFVGIFAGIFSVNAQTKSKITGTVKDAVSGELLLGVNIRVAGTSEGTVSGLDGDFSLDAPNDATLVFSYIGYDEVSEKVAGRKVLDVKMNMNSQEMDEVIVVGYTTVKRRDVLGAVSKVDNKALSALPASTTAQALQGRVAGVQISSATGAPGSGVSVRVRGVSSVSSKKDPLYIVDGIPIEDALNAIPPSEIENITVLKDASSAAVYGSRSTNGVVLITTKSGKKGKPKVSYNGQFGVQTHGGLIDMVNTSDYIKLYNEAADTDNVGTTIKRTKIGEAHLNNLTDVDHVASIFRTAPIYSQELSVSGGSDKMVYNFAGSYFKQDGIIDNSGYERGTLRSNISGDVTNWLTLGLNMSGALATTRSVPSSGDGFGNSEGGSVVRYAMFRNPAIPTKDANGNYIDKPSTYFGDGVYNIFFGDGYNPNGLVENTDRQRKEELIFSKLNAVVRLPFDLKLSTNFGVDYKNSTFKVYNKSWGDDNRLNNPNSLVIEKGRALNWTLNSVLEYRKTFSEKHNFMALAGFEGIKEDYNWMNASDQNFSLWDKDQIFIGNGIGGKQIVKEGAWTKTLASFFGQASYDYDGKYYVAGIVRRDGSSNFVGKNRWGTFYSVSAGWNLERENFLRDNEVISKLKLRAGWGVIGNQDVGIYAYSDRYGENFNYPFSGISNSGYAQTLLGNPNLKWETNYQFNAGIDLELWNGAFAFSADFYSKLTKDMLVEASVPPSIGNATPAWVNNGSVLNQGVDLEFMYRKSFKEGGFDIALNTGFLRNEVVDIEAPMYKGRVDQGVFATKTEKGYPIGSFYMYEMAGIFQNDTEILTSAYQGKDIKPGDVKFVDQNGDGEINADDRKHLGSAIPKMTLGLNLSGYWKGFDLGVFFQGAFGQKIYNQLMMDSEGFYRGFGVTQRYFDNHWTGEGSTNEFPRASWKAKANNARVSSRFLENGSYLRLKNIQLGYTFKTKTWGIERLRLYASATNLFTLTKYSGFDPEMTVSANASSEGDAAAGIDWGTYPVPVTYTFGINLTF